MKQTALSIAGFDPSGGAGLQADLKAFSALGCYGMSVITAVTVQNTTGVKNCYAIPIQAIREQLEALFEDIVPDVIKVGMLFNTEVVETVAHFLSQHARHIPIILDPVMVATSGDKLLLPEAITALKERLIPLCTLLTPNLAEAQVLTGITVTDIQTMPLVAENLLKFGSRAVLLKGGHLQSDMANDFYQHVDGTQAWLEARKIKTRNTHGTGCTLSSAIAAHLALGFDLLESCQYSKSYLHKAIFAARTQSVGKGAGPVHHFFDFW
jgi:hydroxymethylpyrimidine/phosphomethylpyrimidine kinase